jgi:hypothetical protein
MQVYEPDSSATCGVEELAGILAGYDAKRNLSMMWKCCVCLHKNQPGGACCANCGRDRDPKWLNVQGRFDVHLGSVVEITNAADSAAVGAQSKAEFAGGGLRIEFDQDSAEYRQLRVDIASAAGLASGSAARAAAFCVVLFNDVKVGRTTVASHEGSPTWANESVCVSLPADASSCSLRIEVYDRAGDFVGQVYFQGSSLENLSSKSGDFELVDKPNSAGLSAQGTVKLAFQLDSQTKCRSAGLKIASPFDLTAGAGTINPACTVYFNDSLIGQTRAIAFNTVAAWDEVFLLSLPIQSPSSLLRVEVHDDKSSTGEKNVLLGIVSIDFNSESIVGKTEHSLYWPNDAPNNHTQLGIVTKVDRLAKIVSLITLPFLDKSDQANEDFDPKMVAAGHLELTAADIQTAIMRPLRQSDPSAKRLLYYGLCKQCALVFNISNGPSLMFSEDQAAVKREFIRQVPALLCSFTASALALVHVDNVLFDRDSGAHVRSSA